MAILTGPQGSSCHDTVASDSAPAVNSVDKTDALPHLAVAVFLDEIETETGGKTLRKIHNQIVNRSISKWPCQPPVTMPPFSWDARAFLSFKHGWGPKDARLDVVMVRPDGRRLEIASSALRLVGGPGTGTEVTLTFTVQLLEPGVHWFDVEVNGHRLTRMPLNVIYETWIL